MKYLSVFMFFLLCVMSLQGQSAFDCDCQRIYYDPTNQNFGLAEINSSNNGLQFPTLSTQLFDEHIAMAFRRTEGVVYILESQTNQLHQYYADGTLITLPVVLNLPADQEYKAGEITPDGRNFYVIGSRFDLDRSIFIINLESGNYEVTEVALLGVFDIQDIAFDPYEDFMYAYDRNERHILKINLNNFAITGLFPIEDFRAIETIFIDTYGDLYGLGTTQFGVAGGLFLINKENGEERNYTTGPVAFIEDATSCPYTVKMRNQPSSENAFPCEEFAFTYTIANATGEVQNNLTFRSQLPPGFIYQNITNGPIGGTVQYNAGTGLLQISDISIPPGKHTIELTVEIDELITGGDYTNQAEIIGLPATLGGIVKSDYPRTPRPEDASPVTVTVLQSDSLFFTRFICIGQSLELEGGIYGTTYNWSNGSTTPNITVSEEGSYFLNARTGCAQILVEFEVTIASCPFRLDLDHLTIPDSTFPCTEVIYYFAIDNSTGVTQERIMFTDTLPDGVDFLDIISNPFGGDLVESDLPDIVRIDNMVLPTGIDTIQFLVEVGDIDPGAYQNQARLDNLPLELGTFRYSDDPRTIGLDSTDMIVLGVDADTLLVEVILCEGQIVELDATIYGTRFEWYDGSTEGFEYVDQIGSYQVTVFNGCEESQVFFEVVPGAPIDIRFVDDFAYIGLGDTIVLNPILSNTLDSLEFIWSGPDTSFLRPLSVLNPSAFPLNTTTYQLWVSNGVCNDSASIKVFVDNTRRLFVPNIFTPNSDGENDYFSIYSPDFGQINLFQIFDRRGNMVFESKSTILNEQTTGWDGTFENRLMPPGVYLYNYQITFLDGFTRHYTGDVTLLR